MQLSHRISMIVLPILILVPSVAFGGIITSASTATGFVNAGLGTVLPGSTFTMDIFAADVGGGGSQVGFFNLQVDIVNVSGVNGKLTFAAPASQSTAFRTNANYIFNSSPGQLATAGRSTNTQFFSNTAGVLGPALPATSIRISDGVQYDPVFITARQTDLAVTGPRLLARVTLQADPTMGALDQYRIVVNGNTLNATNFNIANEAQGANPNFVVDRFGYFLNPANGQSYNDNVNVALSGPIQATQSLIIVAVPEPSSFALLGVAMVGAVGLRFRSRLLKSK